MLDDIAKLLEIQRKDAEILSLREEEEKLIADLSRQEGILDRTKRELEGRREERRKMAVSRDEGQLDLDSKLESVKKLELQLFQLKTNKEYQALQREIGALKEACTDIEDRILNFMENIESVNSEIKEHDKSVAEMETGLAKAAGNLDREKGRVTSEIQRLDGEKRIIGSSVDQLLMARYEKILSHYGSRAIVLVVDDICQGCYTNLPRHTVDEIRVSEKPILCENCARILYLDDHEGRDSES